MITMVKRARGETNKLGQYGLLVQWHGAEQAPDDVRSDLSRDIRPGLDRLQKGSIQALADAKTLRAEPDCRARFARKAGLHDASRA
ncbi:hypothetical protein N6G02_13505 [Cupriavidus gilardii]|uniref:hypothetical protein n=1 Tax=Cupriavidus gilardii TaxID=82541 RepID=UPI0021C16655|nr:hypothetical protein [Cupriavidus gilardii]MCT9117147.1 hypothetical protein [Cupriavidus gilardii]